MNGQDHPPGETDAPHDPPPTAIPEMRNTDPAQAATAQQLEQTETRIEERMSGFERSMIRLTTAGIIIAILTGIVFLGQLYEMISGGTQTDKLVDYAKTQAQAADEIAQASDDFTDSAKWMEEHAKDAADAMQDSVDTASENTKTIIKNAQNTTRLDQRAWVVWKGVEGTPELDKTWVVKTYFTNSGKTPAKNVRVNCALIPAKEESELDFNRTAQSEPKPTIIAPNDPTTYCPLNPLTIEKVTKDVLNIFASREDSLCLWLRDL